MLVGTESALEFTLLVLLFAFLDGVFLRFVLAFDHQLAIALCIQETDDLCLDLVGGVALRPKALQEDVVLDVLYHCRVDSCQQLCCLIPKVHVVFFLREVVHEHPVSAILRDGFLVFVGRARYDFLHDFNLLFGRGSLSTLFGRLDFFLFDWLGLGLFRGQATSQPLIDFVLTIDFLFPVDIHEPLDCLVGQEHGDDFFDQLGILLLVDEQPAQRTVIHDLDHIVDPTQLIPANIVRADPLRNAILLAHDDDLVLELLVLLHDVLAPQGPSFVHV